jgi:hypothetical protein
VTIHMLIQILTPFVIFLVIEHFHLSGILAVVAVGIVHAIERDHEESPTVQLQIVSKSTWTVLLYILNGLVFMLLGLQMPSVLSEIFKDPLFNNYKVVGYILLITGALLLLRFVWIYLSWMSGWILKKDQFLKPTLRKMGITTISGVRGAVTLAGAFSIPFVLADGSPFPQRSLILFIAAGVILMSLTAASILLPIMAKSDEEKVGKTLGKMEKTAFIRTQEAAIRAMRELMNEENREAVLAVLASYNHTVKQHKYEDSEIDSSRLKKEEMEIRIMALESESQYIAKLIKEKRIDRDTAYQSQEYIRRMEIAVTNRMKYRGLVIWTLLKRSVLRMTRFFAPNQQELRIKRKTKLKKLILVFCQESGHLLMVILPVKTTTALRLLRLQK